MSLISTVAAIRVIVVFVFSAFIILLFVVVIGRLPPLPDGLLLLAGPGRLPAHVAQPAQPAGVAQPEAAAAEPHARRVAQEQGRMSFGDIHSD